MSINYKMCDISLCIHYWRNYNQTLKLTQKLFLERQKESKTHKEKNYLHQKQSLAKDK